MADQNATSSLVGLHTHTVFKTATLKLFKLTNAQAVDGGAIRKTSFATASVDFPVERQKAT